MINISQQAESITYYSKTRMGFTGKENAGMDCHKGSSWKLTWDPIRRSVKEFLIEANTDPELENRAEVEKWFKELRR